MVHLKHEYIDFYSHLASQKPDTLRSENAACPFCNRELLLSEHGILDSDGDKVLMKNKYPVLENTLPLVYVETLGCGKDITNYPYPVLIDVVCYGLLQWEKLLDSGEFESVIFYKNHGPYSSGSILHPHMQMIGLYDKNPIKFLDFSALNGTVIQQEKGFEWSISHFPFSEGLEFTIRMNDRIGILNFAQAIQYSTHYIVNHYSAKYKSFNLSFYRVNDEIIVKVMDRRPVTPLLSGYRLSQVPNNMEEIKTHIQQLYLNK